jgi:hypothetical protein
VGEQGLASTPLKIKIPLSSGAWNKVSDLLLSKQSENMIDTPDNIKVGWRQWTTVALENTKAGGEPLELTPAVPEYAARLPDLGASGK